MALTEPLTQGGGETTLEASRSPMSSPTAFIPPVLSSPTVSTSSEPRSPEIKRILGLSVPCSVILADRDMSIQSILGITVGTIVEFNVPFDADLTLYISNRPIARGKAIKMGENFGLRIDTIDTIEHRIDALAGR